MEQLNNLMLHESTIYNYRSGFLDLWLCRTANEWKIAYNLDSKQYISAQEFIEVKEKPSDIDWIRIISSKTSDKLSIKPSMPDKPVVFQSPEEIRVPEKMESTILVGIPVFTRIFAAFRGNEQLLLELPTVVMSKTWFGDTQTGMIAYSLNTDIITSENCDFSHNIVCCRIRITNSSRKAFVFRKLSIPVNNMNIYSPHGRETRNMFTDTLTVDYADEDKIRITVDDTADRVKKSNMVFEAQKSLQEKYILIKGVTSFIRTIAGV